MNGGIGSAYGAGKAGSATDPISFLIQPQVILRLLCWVRSWKKFQYSICDKFLQKLKQSKAEHWPCLLLIRASKP